MMQLTARDQFRLFLSEIRRAARATFVAVQETAGEGLDDVRLFAWTFGAGFVFTSLFIA